MAQYPLITQRMKIIHRTPALMEDYLALMVRRRGACDEVWFSTEYGFPPLEVHLQSAQHMAEAAARVREAGIVASLQISNTLGHGSYLKYLDFRGRTGQRIVGADGVASPYANCPRDPALHLYLHDSTLAYCAWQPQSVWIDDDLQLHGHRPARFTCFCPRCLHDFSGETGTSWTRETLAAAVGSGHDRDLRQGWIDFGGRSLAAVAETVTRAVLAAAPACRMGLQHCDPGGGYNGPDWAHIFDRMAQVSGRPVGSRPGGGVYADHAPRDMIGKALRTSLANSRLPACVDDCRVEVENWPGAITGKSAVGTVLEATLALAHGCTGLTFTPLMFPHEEIAWHQQVLAKIDAWRPFWRHYLDANCATRPAGMEVVFDSSHALRPLAPVEEAFAWASCDLSAMTHQATRGVPLCWTDGVAALLHPHAADGLDEDALRALLRRGVVTDGESLLRLQARGYGSLLPVEAALADDRDAIEKFTGDPLNGAFAGREMGLSSLSGVYPACALTLRRDGRCVSRYLRYDGAPGGMAVTAVDTVEGGRLVVFGHGLWEPVVTTARRAQMLATFDWVARQQLPVLVETPAQLVAIPRADAQGRVRSVLLLNASLDDTPQLHLRVRRPAGRDARWLQPVQLEAITIAITPYHEDGSISVILPPLPGWQTGVLVFA